MSSPETEPEREAFLPARKARRPLVRDVVVKYGFILVTVGLFVFFLLTEPTFRKSSTLISTLRYISVTAIIGLGVTTTKVASGMDLSVGSVAGLAVTVTTRTMVLYNQVGAIAIIAVRMVGALAGAINALLIVLFKIPDTLSTMFVLQALKLVLVSGQSVSPGMTLPDGSTAPVRFTPDVLAIDRGTVGLVPTSVLIVVLLTVAGWVFLARTRWGRVL